MSASDDFRDDVFADLEAAISSLSETRLIEALGVLDDLADHPAAHRLYDQVRPRLKRLRPPRRPTLQRLFCAPFEDLLIDARGEGWPMLDGRILRTAMRAAWAHVAQHAGFGREGLEARLRAAPAGDAEARDAIGREVWRLGAEILASALLRPPAPGPEPLFGPGRMWREDVAQIARALDMGSAIQGLKVALPPAPIRALDEAAVQLLRNAVVGNARGDATRAFALLSVMLVRVSPPGLLMERLASLDLALVPAERTEMMRWLSASLTVDLDRRARALSHAGAADGGLFVAADLRDLAQAIDATEKALGGMAGEGRVRDDVLRFRAEVEKGLDATLAATLRAIDRLSEEGGAAGPGAWAEAEQRMLGLRICAPVAMRFGRGERYSEALSEVAARARATLGEISGGLVGLPADPAAFDVVRPRMFQAVRLLELSAGSAEADAARREAMDAFRKAGDRTRY